MHCPYLLVLSPFSDKPPSWKTCNWVLVLCKSKINKTPDLVLQRWSGLTDRFKFVGAKVWTSVLVDSSTYCYCNARQRRSHRNFSNHCHLLLNPGVFDRVTWPYQNPWFSMRRTTWKRKCVQMGNNWWWKMKWTKEMFTNSTLAQLQQHEAMMKSRSRNVMVAPCQGLLHHKKQEALKLSEGSVIYTLKHIKKQLIHLILMNN